MELKGYQIKVVAKLKDYLTALSEFREKFKKAIEFDPEMAMDYNFPRRAWEKTVNGVFSHKNGIGEPTARSLLKSRDRWR